MPIVDFIPTAFGRQIQRMGPVEPDEINGIGFMLSDKNPGPFTLEIDWGENPARCACWPMR